MEVNNPREVKGCVVKLEHALVTPFREATALEADTMQIYTKKTKYDLRTL